MKTDQMPVVCAWCALVVVIGNPELPVSHTICEKCTVKLMQNMLAQSRAML